MADVTIDSDALEFITRGPGPYAKPQEDGSMRGGYWHKPDHRGPDSCAGCAVEKALETPKPKTWDGPRYAYSMRHA